MKISEVIEQFMRNMKEYAELDARLGYTREESTIRIQAIFLRASAQLFHRDDKADFARTAKIAWDTVHK